MDVYHHRPTWTEINLDNLINNFKEIRRVVGQDKKIMAVVKADAYGHGAVECAKVLVENGADRLAVAFLDEAIQLRKAGIKVPIMILGYTSIELIPELVEWNIIPSVYNIEFAKALSIYMSQFNKPIKIHIKVDTGMGRIGFRGVEKAIYSIKEIYNLALIEIEGLFSHFSVSDEKNKDYSYYQLNIFNAIIEALEQDGIFIPIKHIANSAAIIDLPEAYYNMVRPGIILYGLYPSKEVDKNKIKIKPVMTFKTRIVHIKEVEENSSISYGRKYITQEKRIIATLPVGYADGYTRMLNGKAKVLINGQLAPIVGTICMDQCMADVSNIKNLKNENDVILFGENLPIDEIADKLHTINYEMVCMTKNRVPKIYIKDGQEIKMKNNLIV